MTSVEDWPRCKAWIEAALEYAGGTHAIEDVEAMIEAGEVRVFPGQRSAAVVELFNYPRKSVAHVWLMGGDLKELLGPLLDDVAAWAKTQGCSEVIGGAYARAGWMRRLARAGFAPGWLIVRKHLT